MNHYWPGDIPVTNLYTAGVAGERFLREIKDHGRFTGTRCETCKKTFAPPLIYCPDCFSELTTWVTIATSGKVIASTVDKQGAYAVIQLDGACNYLVHKLEKPVAIGQKVSAVFKAANERTGAITDILYFNT